MSNFLTMEDFKHVKRSHRDMNLWDQLCKATSIAAKKYNTDKSAQKQVEVKKNALRVYRRRQHNKEKNLTSYVIRDFSKTDSEKLIKGRKKVKDSVINKSSRKADTLKRKLEETMSNEEWIKVMEMKRKMQKNKKNGCLNPPPPLPSLAKEYESMILKGYGGTGIIRVIHKSLQTTDVSKGHNRLSIPCSQVESFKFLNDEEMTQLRLGQSITVPLIYKPRRNGVPLPLSEISLEFKQWDVHSDRKDPLKISYQYVLRTNWNTLVLRDELEKGDIIQIWAFRDCYNKLCMTLVKL